MPQFSTPLSGLSATSNALSVVANNLANLNTPGYKGQSASFRDQFYQSLGSSGSGDPMQVGGGVAIGSITTKFTNGNTSNTGVSTDVAISGSGFFVTDSAGAAGYTRDGHFSINDEGYLITESGQLVMGYKADANGVVSSAQTLSALQMSKGMTIPATPTGLVRLNMNLNADASAAQQDVTVYDSLGTAHVMTFKFTKDPSPARTWSYSISMPKGDFAESPATDPVLQTGKLTFDTSGKLTTPSANISGIKLPTGAGAVTFKDGAESAGFSFSWQLLDDNNNGLMTQTGSASGASSTYQNGYASGTLNDYVVNTNGTIEGKFSNGQTMTIGQLALATFANEQGLERTGGNGFSATLSSGAAVVGVPQSGGRGKVAGNNLELSNVDMATEFSNLIVTQRGYQANAKVITTFDEITQETINLKR
jgi:flagellar hook protein FlgE